MVFCLYYHCISTQENPQNTNDSFINCLLYFNHPKIDNPTVSQVIFSFFTVFEIKVTIMIRLISIHYFSVSEFYIKTYFLTVIPIMNLFNLILIFTFLKTFHH